MAKSITIGTGGRQLTGTKMARVSTIMASRDFVDGFNEVRKGKPFDYSRECKADEWYYERGRQLALIYSGPLKEGRRVLNEAYRAYVDARTAGIIL